MDWVRNCNKVTSLEEKKKWIEIFDRHSRFGNVARYNAKDGSFVFKLFLANAALTLILNCIATFKGCLEAERNLVPTYMTNNDCENSRDRGKIRSHTGLTYFLKIVT